MFVGQKAPSAKRCIKTQRLHRSEVTAVCQVRKHRAPKGALRQSKTSRYHAPRITMSESTERQKVH